MTGTNICDEVRYITKTDTAELSDTVILNGINYQFYPEVISDILKAQGYRNLTMEYAYTDLVSVTGLTSGDNGYKGEYAFPSDLLKLKRVEINYDDSEYNPAKIYDPASNVESEYDDDDLEDYTSKESPKVKIGRNSFFIRPVPTTSVTNGIYIEYEQRQQDITTETEPQFEKSFHYLLVYKSALRYAMRNQDVYNPLWKNELEELQEKMERFYRDRIRIKRNLPTLGGNYE